MQFEWSEQHEQMREAVERLCARFDLDYWRERDGEGGFPHDFHRAMAEGGWLGIAMPEEFGGSGLGIVEAAILMQAVAQSGAGMSGCSAIHLNIFGPHPIVKHGTDEQRRRMLPELIAGGKKACFAVTEPDSGLNTSSLKTRAEPDGKGGYVVHGQKLWTSTAQVADKMLLIARTTPREQCQRAFDGLTLFYTDFDRRYL
ncbi:MAG: acyl-CoA dehydrogenase, partial [Alphaproteobacteria bacterium]|nr:acyl-CoA dehydrogenase [Alphaproteobacteria bacterium]